MEKVLLNENTYELVANGYQITSAGGRLIIQPGEASFDEIESDAGNTSTITLLDSEGEVLQKNAGLIYTGNITKDANYVVGTESVQSEVDENGEVVTTMQDVYGIVYILEFREPDLREQLAETNAKVDYLAMMTDVDLEV